MGEHLFLSLQFHPEIARNYFFFRDQWLMKYAKSVFARISSRVSADHSNYFGGRPEGHYRCVYPWASNDGRMQKHDVEAATEMSVCNSGE